MRTNFTKLLICLSIGLTVLCSILTYFARRQKIDDLNWVLHTHKVIEEVVTLLTLIQDAENGQRGYLLTNNSKYLTPYLNAIKKIDDQILEIQELTSDNIAQQHNLRKLNNEVIHKIRLIDTTLYLEKAEGPEVAISFIKNGDGLKSMDSIRSMVKNILSEEDGLLEIRNTRLQHSVNLSSLISYCSMGVIGLISIISLIVLNKKQKARYILIKNLNETNLTLERQVRDRTKDLETINKKLVLLNEDKNQFLGMAAHDLKNPLNTIKGLVNILHSSSSNLSPDQNEILDHINKSTSKMSKLISDLLDINRIDQGKTDIHFENADILEITESVLKGFDEIAHQKGISLKVDNLLTNKYLSTDKSALIRVLENLISNAIKFSLKGKEVSVKLGNNDGDTFISIQDQGPGIKEEEKHLMFGKFQKLSNRPTEGESSTGLGLSIVKLLVEAMNGSIDYTSEVGVGTTFILRFKS